MEVKIKVDDFNNELKNRIIRGEFFEARKLAQKLKYDELRKFILSQECNEYKDVVFYFFLEEWAIDSQDDKLFELTSILMSFSLNWIPGAYNVALKHLQKAIEIQPENTDYKSEMLLFHEIPERLITLEEAGKYAQEVLEVYPDDKFAQRIMKRIENKKKES